MQDQSHCTPRFKWMPRKAIKDKQQEMQQKQNLLLVNAENILNNNKACEEWLVVVVKLHLHINESMPLSSCCHIRGFHESYYTSVDSLYCSTQAWGYNQEVENTKQRNSWWCKRPDKKMYENRTHLPSTVSVWLKTPAMGPLFMPALPRSDCGSGTTSTL